jgi:hypothetical protein
MFSASYDVTTKIISVIVCCALIGGAIIGRSVVGTCIAVIVLGAAYAFSPRSYAIFGGSVLIKRLIGDIRIPLSEIREVRAADAEDLRGCIRVFGNGGLFGYYGKFRTSKLGICDWYVTQRSKSVIIAAGTKVFVISPDDVNGFISEATKLVPNTGTLTGKPDSYSSGRRWNLIGAVIGILAVLFGAGVLLYSPGPPKYTLTSTELTIHDRFYPATVRAAEVDVEHIRIVNLDTDPHWRPTARTNGFGGLHYHSGWFRVAGGEKVRMYRADSRRLVLLPPIAQTAPVLIEVKQPDAFIQAVQQAWK